MYISEEICKSLDDKEIISRSLENMGYFRCVYLRYEKSLKRYIFKISNFSNDEADDILQNAFLNIWKNLNSYDNSMKLSSFIYRIVHNETISRWRKTNADHSLKEAIINSHSEEEPQEEINKSKYIQNILNKMPQKYKEILVLKFLENMDYEEISNILKIPEGTVATRINRAKKSFVKISKI